MSFSIVTIPPFERNFKRLLKKYPSLKADLHTLIEVLEENPTFGIPLGENCFKIRLAIRSKSKGKSGGARLITMVKFDKERMVLLAIYDKAEVDTIDEKLLDSLINLADQLF
jgi:hypothetical protein